MILFIVALSFTLIIRGQYLHCRGVANTVVTYDNNQEVSHGIERRYMQKN